VRVLYMYDLRLGCCTGGDIGSGTRRYTPLRTRPSLVPGPLGEGLSYFHTLAEVHLLLPGDESHACAKVPC
jgi:hypothetical protein